MHNNIIDYIKNKKIAILGFGREGKSSYKLIRKYLPKKEITVLDQSLKALENILDENLKLITENYLDILDNYDLVIKSPGISLINKTYNTEITSQFDLLLRFGNFKLIGITGTKGKSTTSSLIYEVIKNQIENTFYVGNIGIPVFDYIEEFNENSIVVAEMSAHQLNDLKKSPYISILLNLFPEHLDYFYNLDNYYNAKLNIFRYQNKDDYSLFYEDNIEVKTLVNKLLLKSNIIPIKNDDIINDEVMINANYKYDFKKGQNLQGLFNKLDIIFALNVANILKIDLKKAEEVIRNFKTLPHRMELVGIFNEIAFYDDTLATIPTATINSINSLENVNTLIIGGMDRKIDYDEFIDDLISSKVQNIICEPDTGLYIYNKLREKKTTKKVFYSENMKHTIKLAFENTLPNTACLLSPSAPSYNIYKNYEEKSQKYIEAIKEYTLHTHD